MDRQPVLEGERLVLRPLAREDWAGLYAIAADPLLWEQHPMHDRWQEEVFRTFFDDALAMGGALVAVDKASGRIVGSSRFTAPDPENGGSLEIGWTLIARDLWGTGANPEMKRLMLTHALASVARVRFRIGEENWRSRKAMEAIGGRLTDVREEVQLETRRMVHVVYEVTRDSFASGPLCAPR